jgi:hypothetical protein
VRSVEEKFVRRLRHYEAPLTGWHSEVHETLRLRGGGRVSLIQKERGTFCCEDAGAIVTHNNRGAQRPDAAHPQEGHET